MTCSPTDFICQAQSAILTFLAIHWEAILLGLVAVLLVLFAPLKFKFLGALVLFIMFVYEFGFPWFGFNYPPHFGLIALVTITTERGGVLALDDDQHASIRGGKLLIDWRVKSRIFMKIAEVNYGRNTNP